MAFEDSEPCYVISVAARMLGVHAQTLRYYERVGLIEPSRSQGNRRLFSTGDIERLRQIKTLINDLGINLAGAEVILRMSKRMSEMEKQINALERRVKQLTQGLLT